MTTHHTPAHIIRSGIRWVAYKIERLNTWLERLEGRVFGWVVNENLNEES